MKDVTIQYREKGEMTATEEAIYVQVADMVYAIVAGYKLKTAMTDDEAIATSTRVLHQLAANATRLAAEMGVTV